jgi:Tol biopolymer transport system component
VTTGPGGGGFPIAYSPDGTKILFLREPSASERPDNDTDPELPSMNLFVINADGTGIRQLNPPGTWTSLIDTPVWAAQSWSPDGRFVAFVGANGSFSHGTRQVWVVRADGTDAHAIAISEFTAAWSPDGQWIATDVPHLGGRDLYVVHPDGTGLTEVTSAADGFYSFGAAWSPDSSRLLFVRGRGSGDGTDLWIQRIDGTGLRQVTHMGTVLSSYGWSPVASVP